MISISCLESKLLNNNNWYGRFQLAPFQKGQGLTIANALRRTLLAEKNAFFISWVDFYNAEIPYSVLTGMRESVFDILLNLKQVIFTSDNIIPNNNYYFKPPYRNNLRTQKLNFFSTKSNFEPKIKFFKQYALNKLPNSTNRHVQTKKKNFIIDQGIDHKISRDLNSSFFSVNRQKTVSRPPLNQSINSVSPIIKKKASTKRSKLQNVKNQKRNVKTQNLFGKNQILGKTFNSDNETSLVPLKLFGRSSRLEKQSVDTFAFQKKNNHPYIGYICAKGPAVIYAKNIKLPKGLKCVDPDKYIVTLADDGLFYLRFALTTEMKTEPVIDKFNVSITINQGIKFNTIRLKAFPKTLFNQEIESHFKEFSYSYMPSRKNPPKSSNQQFLNNSQLYFIDNYYTKKYPLEREEQNYKTNRISPTKTIKSESNPKRGVKQKHSLWSGIEYITVNAKKRNNFESPKKLYHSQPWSNGYTQSLINEQRLLLTNDSIKQLDFQNTSISASIQKTCLLNIQIKHYYYKSGRFDRLLFDLIKPFKPNLKSTYYHKPLLKNKHNLFFQSTHQRILTVFYQTLERQKSNSQLMYSQSSLFVNGSNKNRPEEKNRPTGGYQGYKTPFFGEQFNLRVSKQISFFDPRGLKHQERKFLKNPILKGFLKLKSSNQPEGILKSLSEEHLSNLESTLNKIKSPSKHPLLDSKNLRSSWFVITNKKALLQDSKELKYDHYYRNLFQPNKKREPDIFDLGFSVLNWPKVFRIVRTNSIYDYLQKLNIVKAIWSKKTYLIKALSDNISLESEIDTCVNSLEKTLNSFQQNYQLLNLDQKWKYTDSWVSKFYEPYIEKFLDTCISFQCFKNNILCFLKFYILQYCNSSNFLNKHSVSIKNKFCYPLFRSNSTDRPKFITKLSRPRKHVFGVIKLLRKWLSLTTKNSNQSMILLLKKKTTHHEATAIFPWVNSPFLVEQIQLLEFLSFLNQNKNSISTNDNYLRELNDSSASDPDRSLTIEQTAPSFFCDKRKNIYETIDSLPLSTNFRAKSSISIGQIFYQPIWTLPNQLFQKKNKLASKLDTINYKINSTSLSKKTIKTKFKSISQNNVILKPIYLNIEQIIYILKQKTKFHKNQRLNSRFDRSFTGEGHNSHYYPLTSDLDFQNYKTGIVKNNFQTTSRSKASRFHIRVLGSNFVFKNDFSLTRLNKKKIGKYCIFTSFSHYSILKYYNTPSLNDPFKIFSKNRKLVPSRWSVFDFLKPPIYFKLTKITGGIPVFNQAMVKNSNLNDFLTPLNMLSYSKVNNLQSEPYNLNTYNSKISFNFRYTYPFKYTIFETRLPFLNYHSKISNPSKTNNLSFSSSEKKNFAFNNSIQSPDGLKKQDSGPTSQPLKNFYFGFQSMTSSIVDNGKNKTGTTKQNFKMLNQNYQTINNPRNNKKATNSQIVAFPSFDSIQYNESFKIYTTLAYTCLKTYESRFSKYQNFNRRDKKNSPVISLQPVPYLIKENMTLFSNKNKNGIFTIKYRKFNYEKSNSSPFLIFYNHSKKRQWPCLATPKDFLFSINSKAFSQIFQQKIRTGFNQNNSRYWHLFNRKKLAASVFSKIKYKNTFRSLNAKTIKLFLSAINKTRMRKFISKILTSSLVNDSNYIKNLKLSNNFNSQYRWPIMNNIKFNDAFIIIPCTWSFDFQAKMPWTGLSLENRSESSPVIAPLWSKILKVKPWDRLRPLDTQRNRLGSRSELSILNGNPTTNFLDWFSTRLEDFFFHDDAFGRAKQESDFTSQPLRVLKNTLVNHGHYLDWSSNCNLNNELPVFDLYPKKNLKFWFSNQNFNQNIERKQFLISKFKTKKSLKNLAINFENIYYRNFLWNSRKITLRILNNAVIPLVANRKYSISDFIPKKNYQNTGYPPVGRFIKGPISNMFSFSGIRQGNLNFSVWSHQNLNNIIFENKNKIPNTITENWLHQFGFSSQFYKIYDYQKLPFYSIRHKILGTTSLLCSKTDQIQQSNTGSITLPKNKDDYLPSSKNELPLQQSRFFLNSSFWSLHSKWKPFFTGSLRQEKNTGFESVWSGFPKDTYRQNKENERLSSNQINFATSIESSGTPEKLAFLRRHEWTKKLIQGSKSPNSEDTYRKNEFTIKSRLVNNLWLSSFFCSYSLNAISTKSDLFLQNLISNDNYIPSSNEIGVLQANNIAYDKEKADKNLFSKPILKKEEQSQDEISNHELVLHQKRAIGSYHKTIQKILKSRDYQSENSLVPIYHYNWQKTIDLFILGRFKIPKFNNQNQKIRFNMSKKPPEILDKHWSNHQFFLHHQKKKTLGVAKQVHHGDSASQNSNYKRLTPMLISLKREISKNKSSIRRLNSYERYFGNPLRRRTSKNELAFYKSRLPIKLYKEFTTQQLPKANQHIIKSWKLIIATAEANTYFCLCYPLFIKNCNLPWSKSKHIFFNNWPSNRFDNRFKPAVQLTKMNSFSKIVNWYPPSGRLKVINTNRPEGGYQFMISYTQLSSSSNNTYKPKKGRALHSKIWSNSRPSTYLTRQNPNSIPLVSSYGMIGYFTIKEGLNSIYKVNYIVESQMSESKNSDLLNFYSNLNNNVSRPQYSRKDMPTIKKIETIKRDSVTTDSLTVSNFLNETYSFVPSKTIILSSFNEYMHSKNNGSKIENENEYIQIDIWTNGELSPRQALLNGFRKLFELFFNLSKYNCLKPIEI